MYQKIQIYKHACDICGKLAPAMEKHKTYNGIGIRNLGDTIKVLRLPQYGWKMDWRGYDAVCPGCAKDIMNLKEAYK
jgi:hypothetical protein